MRLQTCKRHPNAGRFMATCSGCAQELYDIEQANRARAEAERVAIVGKALGFSNRRAPQPFLGETATSLTMWSQHELNTVYERVGGTVTTRIVERTCSTGSTWQATEITLTVEVDGVGPVTVSTDWDEESGGRDLPLIQAIPDATLIAVLPHARRRPRSATRDRGLRPAHSGARSSLPTLPPPPTSPRHLPVDRPHDPVPGEQHPPHQLEHADHGSDAQPEKPGRRTPR